MIFTEIVLHNFGIYKGRHNVDLTPKSAKKPIILFGGLNGGGKTTFLDALQLTLYGKFAKCSNRGELSYHDYLKEAINRHVDPADGAALELEFVHHSEGKQTTYRIKRYWKSTRKGIKETMEVIEDDVFNLAMSEQWYEYVDEFFPSNISGLFFFDGEQIENLANPESSTDIINTGIMSLLGIDLVDKLRDDLRTLERRRLAKQVDSKVAKIIGQAEEEANTFEKQLELHNEKLANKASEIDSLKRQVIGTRRDYKKHGGELYEQRELIEKQHYHDEQQLKNIEHNIRKYAEGAAPLLLVESLIKHAQKQSKKESAALINREIISSLNQRDENIVSQYSEQTTDKDSVALLNEILVVDRLQRSKSAQQATPLNIRSDILSPFDKTFFAGQKEEARQLKLALEQVSQELAITDKQLSAVPEADMIRGIARALKVIEDKHKIAQGELKILQTNYDETARLLTNKQIQIDRLLHNANDEQLGFHRSKRILEHTAEVQKTLTLYRKALIDNHIGRLQALVKESFTALIRKTDLVHDIRISPESFTLNVISQQGEIIPANRLSAGERQLLAISMLWGLAKASSRPLPVIIDTPLGRLDSEHRSHLVDNYFPNASHQVILLSTDTEIDREYRNDLAKSIGKEYHIQYREKQQSSTITPGYF